MLISFNKHNPQIRLLKNRFKEIVKFLKKPTLTKQDKKKVNLYTSPWYLMLGPRNAGKTTLLANADIRFTLQKAISDINTITNTMTYEWWATKNAVLVDTPGLHFNKKDRLTQETQNMFFKLLRKYSYKHALNAIVITISIDDLAPGDEKINHPLAERIANSIDQLSKLFGKKVPIYVVVNKCDLITGFREFFGELSRDERFQPWGIFLEKHPTKLIKRLTLEFNKLMRRLNDQLIFRLQHELNQEKRFLVNEFPLQMEQAKQRLLNLIDEINIKLENKFQLKGLFFTAATQKPPRAKPEAMQSKAEHTALMLQTFTDHSFFVHDLFDHLIFQEQSTDFQKKARTHVPWLKTTILTAIAAGVIIYFATYLFSFKQQSININSVQQTIASYQLLSQSKGIKTSSLTYKLKLLDTLSVALNDLNNNRAGFYAALHPSSPTDQLRKHLTVIYNDAVRKLLQPEITKQLNGILQNAKASPEQQYDALKTYLMLQNTTKDNTNNIIILMHNIWHTKYSEKMQKQLLTHLQALLKTSPTIHIASHIVDAARNNLRNLSSDKLAYIILESNVPNNQLLSLNLKSDSTAASILTFTDEDSGIMSMYTEANFPEIFPNLIEESAKEAIYGNWVLGQMNAKNASKQEIDALAKTVTQQYIEQYVATWSQFMSTIKTINFTKLDQLNDAVNLLAKQDSVMVQLIDLIKTNFPPTILNANPKFKALADLANNNDQTASLDNITKMLNALSDYLSSITSADDPNKAAFNAARERLQSQGKSDPIANMLSAAPTYPEPVKSWLYDIATNAWQLMMYQSQEYIDNAWKQTIYTPYQNQIADHFPFAEHADQQVDIENFTNFFAPNGTFDKFFGDYLQPFIDNDKFPWKLKTLDGESLQLSNATLAELEKVYKIQYVYFQRSSQKLFVPFTLTLSDMENTITSTTIALGNQKVTYQNGSDYPPQKFTWPDEMDSVNARVIFTDENGQQAIIDSPGAFGWFKLLKNSGLHKMSDKPNTYQVVFDKNGNAATAEISFEKNLNPFSLKWFKDFRLPEGLE